MSNVEKIGQTLPTLQGKSLEIVTLRSSFDSKPLSVIRAKETNGDMVVLALVSEAIGGVANYLNVGKNLTKEQLIEITQLTILEYWWLTEKQLILFCQRVKLGKYPSVKMMDTFDGIKWFEMLKLFEGELKAERKRIEDEERQKTYKQWEEEREKDPPKPETLEKVRDFQRRFASTKILEKTESIPLEEDEVIKGYRNDFAVIFQITGVKVLGVDYIDIDGIKMNFREYVNYRNEKENL